MNVGMNFVVILVSLAPKHNNPNTPFKNVFFLCSFDLRSLVRFFLRYKTGVRCDRWSPSGRTLWCRCTVQSASQPSSGERWLKDKDKHTTEEWHNIDILCLKLFLVYIIVIIIITGKTRSDSVYTNAMSICFYNKFNVNEVFIDNELIRESC